MVHSPYDWEYTIRTLCAAFMTLVIHAVLILPPFIAALALVNAGDIGLSILQVSLGIIFFWLLIVFYYIACRFLFQPFSEPKVIDVHMSSWASSQAGVKVTVYRSGWKRTFSSHNIFGSGGAIFLGIETLGLSRPALTFVALHEIAHITARGARVRRLSSILLRYIDSLDDLRSRKSMLLERKTVRIDSLQRGILRLFRKETPLRIGLFWIPIRFAGLVLNSFQFLISMIIGPLTKREEFFADSIASEKMGTRARSAMAECALHFARTERATSKESGTQLATVLKEWSSGDLHRALGVLSTKLTAIKIKPSRPSWYPTWKERYLRIANSTSKQDSFQVPHQFVRCLPIGDNMILSETELVVRAYSYLHPLLLFYLTFSLVELVFLLLSLVLGLAKSETTVATLVMLVFTIPFYIVLAYGFLCGEEEIRITKCTLAPKTKIDSNWDQTDTWLSAKLPLSLRTRYVISFFGPFIVVALLFYIPKLLRWLGPEPETHEALRRLGKVSGRDRIALMKAFSFGPNRQLVKRDYRRLKHRNSHASRRPASQKEDHLRTRAHSIELSPVIILGLDKNEQGSEYGLLQRSERRLDASKRENDLQ